MSLTGKRILVVEDDRIAGEQLCLSLREAGAIAIGPAPTEFYALQLLGRRGIDGAVLDINLHGASVFTLADELIRRGTPIIFAVEESSQVLPGRFEQRPRIRKPYHPADLDAVRSAVEPPQRSPAAPSPPSSSPTPARPGTPMHMRMAKAVGAVMRHNGARGPRGAGQ